MFFIERSPVVEAAVFAEFFAVVGEQDDEGVVVEAEGLEMAEETSQLRVGVGDLAVVAVDHLAQLGPPGALLASEAVAVASGRAPENPVFHYHLGSIRFEKGRIEDAIGSLHESLRIFEAHQIEESPIIDKAKALLAEIEEMSK